MDLGLATVVADSEVHMRNMKGIGRVGRRWYTLISL